jgi:hypothetical protein
MTSEIGAFTLLDGNRAVAPLRHRIWRPAR